MDTSMKRALNPLLYFIFLFLWLVFVCTAQGGGHTGKGNQKTRFVPDQILVKFNDDITRSSAARIHARHGGNVIRTIPRLGVETVKLPKGLGVDEAVKRYRAETSVAFAEPNFIMQASLEPNDPDLVYQWGLHNDGQTGGTVDADMDASEAWDVETGDPQVVIAVLDTGVSIRHPDLIGQLWVNDGEVPDNLVDDDGNGYVDDTYGWAFSGNHNFIDDDNGHGTFCAAIAGAATDNGTGGAGISPGSRIMAVKVLDNGGSGTYDLAAAGIVYAVDNGARILNMSFGGFDQSQALEAAMAYAWNAGAAMFCSAGNDGAHKVHYPAADPYCIAVAATDHDDLRAGFSNVGPEVDVAAPGVAIYNASRYLNEWEETHRFIYRTANGTSASAAFVSGLAGLLWSKDMTLDNGELVDRIMFTADPVHPEYAGGKDEKLGTGRVNARAALDSNITPEPVILVSGQTIDDGVGGDGRADPGETVDLIATLDGNWADATNVTAELSSTDPCIQIRKASVSFGDLPAGSFADNGADPFTVEVSPVCVSGTRVTLNLDLAYGTGNTSALTMDLVAGRPSVLLVDDDGGEGYQNESSYELEASYELLQSRELTYTEALDAAGISYDIWEVPFDESGPTAADMAPYDVVIWNGVAVYDPGSMGGVYIVGISLSEQDFESLGTYLDSGGNLLLTTSNITEYYGSDPSDPGRNLLYEFLGDYFGIQFDGYTSMLIQNYTGSMAGWQGDLFDGLGAWVVNDLIYTFQTQADATPLFTLDDPLNSHYGDPCAVRYPSGDQTTGHRAVFLGFDFDKLQPESAGHHVMATLVGWLRGETDLPAANVGPFADPGEDMVAWDEDDSGSEKVTLDGTASVDPDGDTLSFEWTEGGTVIGNKATVSHDFMVGPHFVRLEVEDSEGASHAATQVVFVQPQLPDNEGPPIPAPPIGPTVVAPGTVNTYTAVADDPESNLVYYYFNWGDGTSTVTGHYPSGEPVQIPHTFSGEGTFEVKVWAFDEHGDAYNGLPCWSEPLYVVVGSGPLPEEADIEITLSDNPDPVKKRQSVVYTSVVSNLGPDPAPGVSFSQTVPARTTLVSTSTSQGSCSSSSTTVDCDLGTIEAGNTVTVEVEIETKRPGTIEVTATAGTGSLPDPDSSNNSVSETTTVTR